MDFNYTEDQRMLTETLSRYLADNYSHDHRMQAADSNTGYNEKTYSELCELGIAGALLPESCGGYGGTGFDITAVFEALGKSLVVEPFLPTATLCANLLNDCGQQALIETVINGDTLIAAACYEPQQRYSLENPDCKASQQQGKWTINGHKTMVMNGDTANHFIVTSMADNKLSLFLLPADADGITVTPYPTIDGGRAADIKLNNVIAAEPALLSRGSEALELLEKSIAKANLAICAEALGAMETCKNMTVEYLQTRKQFGVPIGKFQALQHRMVDAMIEIEQVRSSVINAAASIDGERTVREKNISAMKNLTGRVAKLVAEEAIQLHGGIAMTWEYSLAHYAKRLVMIDHWFGDTDYHLQRFIELSSKQG